MSRWPFSFPFQLNATHASSGETAGIASSPGYVVISDTRETSGHRAEFVLERWDHHNAIADSIRMLVRTAARAYLICLGLPAGSASSSNSCRTAAALCGRSRGSRFRRPRISAFKRDATFVPALQGGSIEMVVPLASMLLSEAPG